MTQQDVAARLERLAVLVEQRHVGVNADMVSKWERGQKQPSVFYVRLLALLFDVSPGQLAEPARPEDVAETPQGPGSVDVLDLLGVLDRHTASLELIQPKVAELWRRDVLNRREVLKAMGAVPAAAGLESVLPSGKPPTFQGSRTLRAISDLVGHLEQTYHVGDPKSLVLPVTALVETIEDLLPEVRERSQRSSMLALLARSNLLAGRLSFFDVHRPRDARWHLDLAREAAQQAGDPVMTSVVYGHMAFLPAAKHNFEASASYVAGARDALARQPIALVESWLSAVEGELNTQAGSLTPARHCIDRARATLEDRRQASAPKWFDFYDANRLNGFDGFTLRKAGDLDGARACLTAAMQPGPDVGPKQRAVTMLDLAATSIEQGDVDYGSRLAVEAASGLRAAGYATAVDRLVEVKDTLPDPRSPQARLLAETLAELS
ncbi:hypothetical protein GCM10027601_20240 [Nocardioides ungokensis]